MLTNVENSRLYLPAADGSNPVNRKVQHPETNSDQVIMDSDGTKLTDFLGAQVLVSSDKPSRNNIMWLAITGTRIE